MKTKSIIGTILGLAVTTTIALPVKADEYNCRIDRRTGMEICENRDRRDDRRNSSTVERRIDELYREVLGRRADETGLRNYSDRVSRNGWSYERVRRELALSREASEQIRNTYRQVNRRNPDSETIRRYQTALARGSSLDEVRREIQNSRNTGRNNRYYNAVERNIDRLYREVLGRRADENGLRTYSDRVERDGWSYERVRRDLAESREATEQLRKAYREIQGENPDSGTIRRYQNDLEEGSSLYEIRQEMQNSRNTRRNNPRYRYY